MLTPREVCWPQAKDGRVFVLAGPERSPSLSSIGGLTWTVEPSAASEISRGSEVNIRMPPAPGTLPSTEAAPRVTSVPMLPDIRRRSLPLFATVVIDRAAYHQP